MKPGKDFEQVEGQHQEKRAYQNAYQEWEARIGSVKTQMKNWRLACLGSIFVMLLLLLCIIIELSMQKSYVYVAEIKPGQHVVNLKTLGKAYQPSEAMKQAFIGHFIHDVMSIPLDPIVLRTNLQQSYDVVAGQARAQLSQFISVYGAFKDLGQLTKVVSITNINALGQNTYDFTWMVTSYSQTGQNQSVQIYNGVFTLTMPAVPKTMQEMLLNPLGLRIGYFSFKQKGSS